MRSKLLRGGSGEGEGERTWVLAFETGDPVVDTLRGFAGAQDLRGAHFTAIGALREVTLRYFDWESKSYRDIPVPEQVEVLTMTGNVARSKEGDVKLHAHLIVGRSDGTTRGGHLKEAVVRPTLEVILTEEPAGLRRTFDEETGLALLKP
ncbi:MAG TPA: PPC domain-containing DNA-binding protein [Longimicrobiaceae bacterium]|nr:PPC domain-containing DNA-binding protein [Longimicrobiaceae bacterium]